MKIPKKQSDILIKNYLKYEEFVKSLTEEQRKDEAYILRNTIKIFYEIDDLSFETIPYVLLNDLFNIIINILNTESKIVPIFKHNNIEYGLLPDFSDMTLGELVDCDTTDIFKQLCILYRPVIQRKGDKYLIEKYKADLSLYDELKDTLTLDIYLGFISFFLRIQKDYINYTLKYIQEMVIDPEKKKVLEQNGLGLVGYMS